MRELLGVAASVALPWIAGALGVAALWRERVEGRGALCIGYGYFAGLLATILLMRLMSALGLRWSFPILAGELIIVACAGWYVAKPLAALRTAYRRSRASLDVLPTTSRKLFWVFLALSALSVVALACCVAWGLLQPFDVLVQWADKARVWYEHGKLVPFVDSVQWFEHGDVEQFWDRNPRYPAAVPLLQVWTALGAGRWDESLVNVPWAMAVAALAFAFYGQVRRLDAGAAKAIVCTYLLLSIPFLQSNVAVAGMADIFVAAAYGLAAMSLWHWTRTRAWQDAALALLLAVLCALAKNEGVLWALTLAPAALVAVRHRLGLIACATLGVAVILYLAFGPNVVTFMGYRIDTRLAIVGPSVYEHLFVMDNWHLLWYSALAIIVGNARRLLGRELAPMTVTMIAGASFVLIVYFFSSAAAGIAEENLVNRFLLQIVPALAFYLIAILRDRELRAAERHSAPLAPAEPAR